MVIAAKTGQGKTLTFALPILDLLIKKIQKYQQQHPEESEGDGSEEGEEENEQNKFNKKVNRPEIFDSVKALIISPTRELAMQIKDMINAVIPVDHQDTIKTCCIVGGMSIQKQ
jgi:superfamily II DNA/RNA helicase